MKATGIKLLIFTIFTAGVTYMLAAVIGNYRPFSDRYVLIAEFDDATGLLRGDLVTLAGVQVGKVRDATVEKGLALVEMAINEEVRLPKSSRIEIRYRNLIGQRVVQLIPGKGGGPYYEEGDRVPESKTDGPLDLDTVFNNLRPLVSDIAADDVNTLSKTLVEAFGAHEQDIDGILADTATLSTELANRDQQLGSLITNLNDTATALVEERDQLSRLLANFAGVTELLADRTGPLDRTLTNLNIALGDFATLFESNRPDLDRDLADLAALLQIVSRHQADLDVITRQIDDVLRATTKAQTYGEWNNLYLVSLCVDDNSGTGCSDPYASSSAEAFSDSATPGLDAIMYGATGRP